MPTIQKIGKYAKNLSKSLAIATVSAIPNKTPNIKSFLDETREISKEVYASAANFKTKIKTKDMKESGTIKNIHKSLKVAADTFVKAVKSGDLYLDVSEKYTKEITGMDMGTDFDFNFDDDFDFDTNSGNENFSLEDLSSDLSGTIGAASVSQSTAIAEGTNLIIESNKANAAISAAYMEKMTASITSSIAAVYSKTDSINNFLNSNMVTHINNSAEYYKNSIALMTEQRDMLKELLDTQRKLYGTDKNRQSNSFKSQYSKVMGYGRFDLKEYIKVVKSKFSDVTGMADMMTGSGGGMNPLMAMASAPTKYMLEFLMPALLPKKISKSLENLDNSFGNIFNNLFAAVNNRSKTFTGGIFDKIFETLSLRIHKKDKIVTNKFERGPIPFDGITKQSIVEVIPGYLARIEAALTGDQERFYDMTHGVWRTASNIRSNFNAMKKRNYDYVFSDLDRDVEGLVKGKDGKKYKEAIEKMKKKIYDDDGYFNPKMHKDRKSGKVLGSQNYDYYGIDEQTFNDILSAVQFNTIKGIARNVAQGKENFSRQLEREETENSIYRILFNETFFGEQVLDKDGKPVKRVKTGGSGLMYFSKDEEGNNIFYYLREILNAVSNRHKKNMSNNAKNAAGKVISTYREFRSAGDDSSSNSGESSEDGSDPDPATETIYETQEEKARREEKEADEKRKQKREARMKWVKDKFGDNKVARAIGSIAANTQSILEKPTEFVSAMIDRADKSLFNLMFGEKGIYRDENGNTYDGVLDYITHKINKAFDKVHKFLDEHFFAPIKKGLSWFFDKAIRPAFEGAKGYATKGIGFVKDLFKGKVKSAEDIENAADGNEDSGDSGVIVTSAGGRIVTKRGLTMISPGEIIIPASFNKNDQARMLSLEKRDRSKIEKRIGLNASGTIDLGDLKDKFTNNKTIKNATENIYKFFDNNKKNIQDIGGGGLLGGGIGLLAGINPLLGAVIGSAIGFIKNSETVKGFLFGKEIENEDGTKTTKDGIIPKSVQDYFKKNAKDLAGFSIGGGLLGLFTPFGLLGGAAIGAAASMVKNSDTFQKFVFGDPDDPEANSLMKALDDSIIGPAKKKMEEFRNAFKDYTKKNIFDPLKNFWDPFKQTIENAIRDTSNGLRDFMKDSFERIVGLPMADFLQEKLFKPFGKFFGKVIKAPAKLAGGIVSAPFKLLGAAGNALQMRNIGRGKAYNLTAQERLNFRNNHAFLSDAAFWRGKDKSFEQDQVFANMTEEELMGLASGAKSGLYSEEQLQEQLGRAKSNLTKTISKSNLYSEIGYDNAATLNKLVQSGDASKVEKFIKKMEKENPGAASKLRDLVKADFDAIKGAQRALDDSRMDQGQINNKLTQLLGREIRSKKDRRNIYELAEAELKNRRKSDETVKEKATAVFNPQKPPEDEVSATNLNTRVIETQGAKIESVIETQSTKIESAIDRLFNKVNDFMVNVLKVINPNALVESEKGGEPAQLDSSESGAILLDAPETDASVSVSKNKNRKGRRASKKAHRAEREAIKEAKKEKDRQRFKTNEDSKENTEERNEEKKKEEEKEKEAEETAETRSSFKLLIDKLLGKKKERKKEGGILDKIHNVMSGGAKFFGFAGGKVGTALKVAAGFSLFGYASQWIKTAVWPKISSLLFGKQYEDGSESKGLFGKLKDSLMGDKDSLLSKLFTWFGDKFNKAKDWFESSGGFSGILSGILNKLLVGGIYGLENVVTPLVALVIKHLPDIALGLVKGIGLGLKMAFTKKTYSRSGGSNITIDDGGATKEIESFHKAASSSASNAGGEFTAALNRIGVNAAGNAAYTKSKAIDVSNVMADVFKDESDKNEKTQFGIGGLLGAKQRNNTIEYDENGNIVTEYSQLNSSDSIASSWLDATGKATLNSFAGIKGGTKFAKTLSRMKIKGFGKGAVKAVSTAGAAVGKATGKIIGVGQKIGSKANYLAGRVAKGNIDTMAKAASKSTGKGVLTKGLVKIFEFIGKSKIGTQICKMATKASGTEVTELVMKKTLLALGEKLGSKIGAKLAGKALTKVAGAVAKFSPIGIAILVADFASGMINAETILGVVKGTYDVPGWLRVVCGLVNLLTETFTFGLVPADLIMDIVIEFIAPIFGADTSELDAARSDEAVNAALDEWNKANPEETYDNIEDFNKKDRIDVKMGKAIKGALGKAGGAIKGAVGSAVNKVGEKFQAPSKETASAAKDAFVKDPGAAIKEMISTVIGGVKEMFGKAFQGNPAEALSYKIALDEESGPVTEVGRMVFNILKVPMAPVVFITGAVGFLRKTITNVIKGIVNINSKINKAKKEMFEAAFDGDFEGVKDARIKEDDGEGAGFTNGLANFVFGVQKVVLSIPAYLIAGINAIKNKFLSQFDGYNKSKNTMKQDEQKIEDAKAGKISLFSAQYWKNASHEGEGVFGVVAHIQTYIKKIASIPEILIKSLTEKIKGIVPDWLTSAWNFITGKVDEENEKIKESNNATSGSGHAYQKHPSIAGMKYGNSNIANAGCAPVAATNLINNLTGSGMTVEQAARYAERTGKTNSSGTDIGYFNSILSANGISNSRTSSSSSVTNALKNGNQVVMLGRDNTNDPGTAFGTRPHFITAIGMDKYGNIIVEDPDSPAHRLVYGKDRVMNSMISSVVTKGKGRRGFGTEDAAEDTATDSTTETTEETSSGVNGLLTEFGNLGKNMLSKMFGQNALALLFGEGEYDSSIKPHSSSLVNNDHLTLEGKNNKEKIWNYLKSKGYSDAGVAGIIGYMTQESSLLPYIVESTQLKSLGYPYSKHSEIYQKSMDFSNDVDSGKISKDKFINTYFGYGLPQFTYETWKKELYENTVEKGKSISSIANQLDYLTGSWQQYVPKLHKKLLNAKDPQVAAIDVLHDYGMPNWKSVDSYLYDNERMGYAQQAYDEFSGSGRIPTNLTYVRSGGAKTPAVTYNSTSGYANNGVDYTTFLETIVTVLMSISSNTALLTKILEILSERFNIDIDKTDIDKAASRSRAQAKLALNELVRRSTNNNTNISSLLGNKDTEYLLKAMSAIASE